MLLRERKKEEMKCHEIMLSLILLITGHVSTVCAFLQPLLCQIALPRIVSNFESKANETILLYLFVVFHSFGFILGDGLP